jgi:hypothetical protein
MENSRMFESESQSYCCPLIEHVLQRSEADREQREASPIETLVALGFGGITQVIPNQRRGGDADRQIDVERPAPREVVRDPTAEHGSERGAHDDAHREDALGRSLLVQRIRVTQNRLRRRDQTSAAQTLHDAPEDEASEARCDAAHERGAREDDGRREEVLAASEAGCEPRGDRDDDYVRDDVPRDDPSAFVDRHAEASLNIRQRDIDDGGVDHFEQGRGDDR